MPLPEKLDQIITPSGLSIKTNFKERVSPKARAGVAALGAGEIFVFGETILGLAVITLALFADRKLRRGNRRSITNENK